LAKASWRVTYVTVILPVVLMLIFVIRTSALEGAIDGIAFYIFKFDALQLLNLNVWATALSQILFSLSLALGPPLLTPVSHIPRKIRTKRV
jgi:SNF family Na+-dependent transporter